MSSLLKVVAVLGLASAMIFALRHRTNNAMDAQGRDRTAATARFAVESALNVASSLFSSGTIGLATNGSKVVVHYADDYRGPRWPIATVAGYSTLTIAPCYGTAKDLTAFHAASACDEATPVPVVLAFLRRDPATQRAVVRASRGQGNDVFQQMALLDSLAFETVPALTCAYRLLGYEDDEHDYDQRGVLGDGGMAASWHAVRWNVAKQNLSWTDEPGAVKVVPTLNFGIDIGGKFYPAGARLPKTLDFASPVQGRLAVVFAADGRAGTMRSKAHDVRQYFKKDDVGVAGSKTVVSPSNSNYTNVEFRHCERGYEKNRVNAVTLRSMCTLAPWRAPFPGACF